MTIKKPAYDKTTLNTTSQTCTVFLYNNWLCYLIKNHDPYNDYHVQIYRPQFESQHTDPVET